MAVDTEAKRVSMLNFSAGDLLPEPAASLSQADRQQLLDLYGGILLTGRATTPSTDPDPGLMYWGGGPVAQNRTTARQKA